MSQNSGSSGRRNAKHDVSYILNDEPSASTSGAGGKYSRASRSKSDEKRSKQYICEYCGYSFKQNSDMNKHIRFVRQTMSLSNFEILPDQLTNLPTVLIMHFTNTGQCMRSSGHSNATSAKRASVKKVICISLALC